MNSLRKTVTRQHRDCNLNPGPSAPESSTLTTRLASHYISFMKLTNLNNYKTSNNYLLEESKICFQLYEANQPPTGQNDEKPLLFRLQ